MDKKLLKKRTLTCELMIPVSPSLEPVYIPSERFACELMIPVSPQFESRRQPSLKHDYLPS